MIRVALHSLGQHKLRTALTILAVLLGVAMISGTYVLTDQIRSGFEDIFQSAYKNVDVIVTPKPAFDEGFEATTETLPASLVQRVAAVEGVRTAFGSRQALGSVVIDGQVVQGMGGMGMPTLVFNTMPETLRNVSYFAGGAPRQRGQVSVVRALQDKHGVRVGQTIGLATATGVKKATVTGLFDFGHAESSLGGALIVILTDQDMAAWYGLQDRVSSIQIKAAGVQPAELRRRIRGALNDPSLLVQTGQESAAEQTETVGNALDSVLTPALLAFGGIAVLVGAFIIFNTFSITIAQRQREFALLRTLGASRRQVLLTVIAEAGLLGAGASVAGLFAGLGVAKGINSLFKAVGADTPMSGLGLQPRTVIVALAVGILVTLGSALIPALRATRVPPVAAMQEGSVLPPSRSSRFAPFFGAGLAAAGAALLVFGFVSDSTVMYRLIAMVAGGVLIFFAVAAAARYVVRPVARILGWPLSRLDRSSGRLARDNAMRNPARTASTAATLMIGLAVVVFVMVFAAGFKASFVDAMNTATRADIIVTSQAGHPNASVSEALVQAVREVPAVDSVSGLAVQQVKVRGKMQSMIAVEPSELRQLWNFRWLEGGSDELVGKLTKRTALVEEQFALASKITVGDRFSVLTREGGRATFTVIGEYRDPNVLNGFVVNYDAWDELFPTRDGYYALVKGSPDTPLPRLQAAVKAALKSYPTVEAQTKHEYIDTVSKQLNQFLMMLYALLAVSVIISLFGIVNTLILTVHERTREIGMLRAIGSSRGQIRRMVRYESVITAIMGGALGVVLGTAFAYIVTTQLGAQGISFSLPGRQLAVCMGLALVVGVLAALVPARRAAKTDILAAIHYE